MLPTLYQMVLEKHLNQKENLTVQLLILMLQSFRQVKLSTLASVFPQPISYESRLRNLQRFLVLPQWNVKLLWFPIIKYWLKQEYLGIGLNREQRRRRKKLKHSSWGKLLVVIDRTQWRTRNLMVVSLVWGKHALPVYWELMGQKGSSNLSFQKKVLQPVLKLIKPYPVIVIGDREFHSAHLGIWLRERGVDFILRQKKSSCIQQEGTEYQALKQMGFQPGEAHFFQKISCNKEFQLSGFNLAVRWKRKYREKHHEQPWYLLTSLPSLKQTLAVYRARWGIETMFKDCKMGGYNLEQTRVNSTRLLSLVLLVAFAYALSTFIGYSVQSTPLSTYVTTTEKNPQQLEPHHSHFTIGLLIMLSTPYFHLRDFTEEYSSVISPINPHQDRKIT